LNITGVMVQYYKACNRELWFFNHQINLNVDNEDILLGKLIHKKSYSRDKKNINLGEVAFDFARKGKDTVIFEVKKSSRLEEPVRYQLYYYLWYAKQLGKTMKGMLVYPKERKTEEVILTVDKETEIAAILKDIRKVASEPTPPIRVAKPYCKRCSYYEFCVA